MKMSSGRQLMLVLLTRKDIEEGQSLVVWEFQRAYTLTRKRETSLVIGGVVDDYGQQLLLKTD